MEFSSQRGASSLQAGLPRLGEGNFSHLPIQSSLVPTPPALQCAAGFGMPHLPISIWIPPGPETSARVS